LIASFVASPLAALCSFSEKIGDESQLCKLVANASGVGVVD